MDSKTTHTAIQLDTDTLCIYPTANVPLSSCMTKLKQWKTSLTQAPPEITQEEYDALSAALEARACLIL